MAKLGSVTVNEIELIEVDVSPIVSGIDAADGSIAVLTDGSAFFLKIAGGATSWQAVDKAFVGLGNVDNTSDANKPISSATQTQLDNKQPLDADLTALAALAGAGFAVRTGTNAWATRSIVAGAGISTTNSDGVFGSPSIINSDRGSVAVTAHEAASDPHPNYETTTELNARDTANRGRANHTGTQLSSTISDFSESVDDRVASLLVAGTNITLSYNDIANTLTINSSGGAAYTDEQAQDAVGGILTDSASIDFTYNDVANTISAAVLPAGVNHNALQNYVANHHIDHSAVNINAGTGLTGGGDITTSRTISMPNVGTAGTFGSATQVPVITTDAQGRISSTTNTSIQIAQSQVTNLVTDLSGKANLAGGNAFTGLQTITESTTANENVKLALRRIGAGDVGLSFEQNGTTAFGIINRSGGGLAFVDNYFTGGSGSELARITASGQLALGTIAPSASAKLQVDSTTQGFLPPRMTSAQRLAIASPAPGLIVYDTSQQCLCTYNGTYWTFECQLLTTAIQTTTSSTYANITEFTTGSLETGLYELTLKGIMQSTATTNGVGLRLVNGTAAFSTLSIDWSLSQGVNGTDKKYDYSQLNAAANIASASVITANTDFPVLGMGVFRISTAGTISVQLRSETNGVGSSIRPNSMLIIRKVGV